LRELIRFDTTNPPGAERRAARYMLEQLAGEGIEGEVHEPSFDRANLIARLPAPPETPRRRSLLLLSHLDVAPAQPDGWLHPPFSGAVADGAIWGRGAVDGKGPLAVFAALVVGLRRLQVPLRRDVVIVATADGENGGKLGIEWLLANFPDRIRASAAITTGGGWSFRMHGKTHFTCVNSEKGIVLVRLTAHGRSGHGGYRPPDNALILLGRALAAIHEWETPVHITPGFQQLVETIAFTQDAAVSRRVRSMLNPLLTTGATKRLVREADDREALLAMCRNSFCPTLLRGGSTPSSVPASAEAILDCRILPGQTADTACAELEARLRARGLPVGEQEGTCLALEVVREEPSSESPPHTELTRCLERAIRRHRQSAGLVPAVSKGATGGGPLRAAGVLVYGFFPTLSPASLATVHAKNERLDLESLEFALKVLWDAVRQYAGAGEQ